MAFWSLRLWWSCSNQTLEKLQTTIVRGVHVGAVAQGADLPTLPPPPTPLWCSVQEHLDQVVGPDPQVEDPAEILVGLTSR